MKPLFKIEVGIYDPACKDDTRKIFFIREDLNEAAILGWQRVMEEQGGSIAWIKSDGTRILLGVFLPTGHPTHNWLVENRRITPEEHYWQLNVKIVNPHERFMFHTTIPRSEITFFPGTYYYGLN